MSGLFFSTESWHPAAERISECFMFFQSKMKVNDISKYCDAIDNIGIIPFSGPDKHMSDWKERKYISWVRREADIRLKIDFDSFIKAPIETQRAMVRDVIIRSLEVVKSKCDARKLRFDINDLIQDIFPEDSNQS